MTPVVDHDAVAVQGATASQLELLGKLGRDLRAAAGTMSAREVRYLVDAYYIHQENRKRTGNQISRMAGEPHSVIAWLTETEERIENALKAALDRWVTRQPVGEYLYSIYGIGPIISAGMLAYIDITRAESVGAIWRFAGLDPTNEWLGKDRAEELVDAEWNKREDGEQNARRIAAKLGRNADSLVAQLRGEDGDSRITAATLKSTLAKRPWNAGLKTLCWKIGESFNKFKGAEKCFYGRLLAERWEAEMRRNVEGRLNREAAAAGAKRVKRSTEAWPWYAGCYPVDVLTGWSTLSTAEKLARQSSMRGEPGSGVPMLPPGHTLARAKRWVVKLFLSHLHGIMYAAHHKRRPARPWVFEHGGHVHELYPEGYEDWVRSMLQR